MPRNPDRLFDRSAKISGIVVGVLGSLALEKLTNMGGNSAGLGVIAGFATMLSVQTLNDRGWAKVNSQEPPEPPYDPYDVSRMRGIGL